VGLEKIFRALIKPIKNFSDSSSAQIKPSKKSSDSSSALIKPKRENVHPSQKKKKLSIWQLEK